MMQRDDSRIILTNMKNPEEHSGFIPGYNNPGVFSAARAPFIKLPDKSPVVTGIHFRNL
ncbi:MAG: hypothetical protein P9L92_15240 [Candidatus Electryonea clarkiae]|nr:hypothetical protein [Candidatus Electryonea clarkiae]MDP8286202.1 hypothetical protein [Candidatus Electryonea clarkiae]